MHFRIFQSSKISRKYYGKEHCGSLNPFNFILSVLWIFRRSATLLFRRLLFYWSLSIKTNKKIFSSQHFGTNGRQSDLLLTCILYLYQGVGALLDPISQPSLKSLFCLWHTFYKLKYKPAAEVVLLIIDWEN